MIKFMEAVEMGDKWTLRQVTINPAHIVAMREDYFATKALNENRMPEGLSKSVSFTRIYLNSGTSNLEVVVAESPSMVEQKINNANRLLKG